MLCWLSDAICFGHEGNSCLPLAVRCPPSCQSCVRGWSRQRRTDRSCRRSCARSGRPGKIWSAQSATSGSRWPSLAWWEAAPLLPSPLPRDPITPTPHPPPPLFRRPQRLAKSNWRPLNCAPPHCPNLPSPTQPANSTDSSRKGLPPSPHAVVFFNVILTGFKRNHVLFRSGFLCSYFHLLSSPHTVFKDFWSCFVFFLFIFFVYFFI